MLTLSLLVVLLAAGPASGARNAKARPAAVKPAQTGAAITDLKASSFRPGRTQVEHQEDSGPRMVASDFKPAQITDVYSTSAWCSDKRKARGAWLSFTLARPVHGLVVTNGFLQKSNPEGGRESEAFIEHGRIKRLTLAGPDGFTRRLAFDDTAQEQAFDLELAPGKYKATIDAVHEGGSEDDVCLGQLLGVVGGRVTAAVDEDEGPVQFARPELAPVDPFRGAWRCRTEQGSRTLELSRFPAAPRAADEKVSMYFVTLLDPDDHRFDSEEERAILHSRLRDPVQVSLTYNELAKGVLFDYPDCTAKEREEIAAHRFSANRCAQIYGTLRTSGADRLEFEGTRSQGFKGPRPVFKLTVAGSAHSSVGARAELDGKDLLFAECKRVDGT